jgi:4-azaleucine resistance transporter AzlC
MFGVSFGLLARTAGLGVVTPIVMSAVVFAGSAQFAATSIVRDGGSTVAAIVAALMLNLRYAPIGLTVARVLPGGRLLRLLSAQLVIDESWAAANRGEGRFDRRVLLGVGASMWTMWVAGTAVGVLGGSALGKPEAFGLDAAFPALFVALVAPQLRSRPAIVAAALGATIALSLTPFVPAGIPIIAAAAACLVGLRR